MNSPHRLPLTAAVAVVLLGGCTRDAAPLPSAPLTQQDVSESVAAIAEQLQRALGRAADDEGVVALQGFPQMGALSNPFFGYGVTLMSAKHPAPAPGALRVLADFELPTGVYTFRDQDGSANWVMDGESDDLILNWSYDKDPETAASGTAEASLTFDWDAQSPTVEVAGPSGERVEVPTGLDLTLQAGDTLAADLTLLASYYSAPGCPAGILEPTSLSVSGTGSFLSLENVGYSVFETDTGETFTTQGKVTLLESGIFLDWNMDIDGELDRADNCFSHSLSLGGGSVAVELGGLSGDVRSVALRFAFDNLFSGAGPSFSGGSVVINGDEGRAITFAGSLSDINGNGVPGDDLTVTFADGSRSTLERLLLEWYPTTTFRHLWGR